MQKMNNERPTKYCQKRGFGAEKKLLYILKTFVLLFSDSANLTPAIGNTNRYMSL